MIDKNIIKKDLKEIKKIITEIENEEDFGWVEIDYKNCPTLSKYGAKPFKIMKRKMRDSNGDVWNNINFFEAQKEAKKLGFRLPDIREILALLEYYKKTKKKVSVNDKKFLGIEELSYGEEVCTEWVEGVGCGFLRGGLWTDSAYAGVFALYLFGSPAYHYNSIGFRCACDLPIKLKEKKIK